MNAPRATSEASEAVNTIKRIPKLPHKNRSERPTDWAKVEAMRAKGVDVGALKELPKTKRHRTTSIKRLSKASLEEGRAMYPEDNSHLRPKTRGDCVDGPRPCPWVGCRHHLYLDAQSGRVPGNITVTFQDKEPWEMEFSCSLDVADMGPHNLQQVGYVTNVTRERVRQIEVVAKKKVRSLPVIQDIERDGWEAPPVEYGYNAHEMTNAEVRREARKSDRFKKQASKGRRNEPTEDPI